MITRKGKIARLPNNIREALNNRLDDGETGATLVEWLNTLPKVQQILAQHFQSRPITEQNLSEWKQGGFLDWKQSENSGAAAENLLENSGVLKRILGKPSGCLIPELAVTLGLLSRAASRNGLTDAADQKCLFQVADRILRLQHGEQREEKLNLERRRVEALERRHRDAWLHTLPKTLEAVVELLKGAMKSYGHTEGSADAGVTAVFNYFGMILEADTSIPAAPPVPAACGERESRTKSDQLSGCEIACASSPQGRDGDFGQIQVPKAPIAQNQAASTTPASENPAPTAKPSSSVDPGKSNQLQVPAAGHNAFETQIDVAPPPKIASTDPTVPAAPILDPSILSRWTDGIEDVPEFFSEYDASHFRDLATA